MSEFQPRGGEDFSSRSNPTREIQLKPGMPDDIGRGVKMEKVGIYINPSGILRTGVKERPGPSYL